MEARGILHRYYHLRLWVIPAIFVLMITLTCKVSEKLASELDALARSERRSKSDLVREALEARLNLKRQLGPVSAYDLVKHLCGSIKSGPSDLATNPEHMKGFGE